MAEPVQLDPRDRLPQMAAALRDWVEHQVNTASVEHPRQTGLRDGAREAACIAVQALSGRLARPTWPEAEAWLREVAAGPRQGPLPAVTRKPGILRPRRAAGEDGRADGGALTEPPAGQSNGRPAAVPPRRVTSAEILAVIGAEAQSPLQIATRLGLKPAQVYNHLNTLKNRGAVAQVGRGAWTLPAAPVKAARKPRRPGFARLELGDIRLLDHLERTGPLRVASIAWAMSLRTGEVVRRLGRLERAGRVVERDGEWQAVSQ